MEKVKSREASWGCKVKLPCLVGAHVLCHQPRQALTQPELYRDCSVLFLENMPKASRGAWISRELYLPQTRMQISWKKMPLIIIKGLVRGTCAPTAPFPGSRTKRMFPKGLFSVEQLWWILCFAATHTILSSLAWRGSLLSVASGALCRHLVFRRSFDSFLAVLLTFPLPPSASPAAFKWQQPWPGSLLIPQTHPIWDGTDGNASSLLVWRTENTTNAPPSSAPPIGLSPASPAPLQPQILFSRLSPPLAETARRDARFTHRPCAPGWVLLVGVHPRRGHWACSEGAGGDLWTAALEPQRTPWPPPHPSPPHLGLTHTHVPSGPGSKSSSTTLPPHLHLFFTYNSFSHLYLFINRVSAAQKRGKGGEKEKSCPLRSSGNKLWSWRDQKKKN